jgi:membrane protein YqaA with SNARE-associated domain
MLRKLYNWVMRAADSPQAMQWLAVISFVESSFFPIPPDAMLVPMVLARPDRAWRIAGLCTIASVIGGFFGYAIGYFLFQTVGQWLIGLYDLQAAFDRYQELFREYGLWIILIKGMTPIPYKLITIASGAAQFDLAVFAVASAVTRGARFYLVAALLYVFGQPIRHFIEKHLTAVTTGVVVLIIAGFLVLRYLEGPGADACRTMTSL